jgi:predicted outer membrane repeat protein
MENAVGSLGDGGAIFNDHSAPVLLRCLFRDNSAEGKGGAVATVETANAAATDCTFVGNTALAGGAWYNEESDPVLRRCVFIANGATALGGAGYYRFSRPTMDYCTLLGNTAESGGGLLNDGGDLFMRNGLLSGNLASGRGGAIRNLAGDTTVIHCTFSGNEAAEGGAVDNTNTSSLSATSSILWANAWPDIRSDVSSFGVVWYSDVSSSTGNALGGLNLSIDPQFLRNPGDGGDGWGDDPATPGIDESANDDFGDLRLQPDSPAVNAGDATFVPLPGQTDLDGHARVLCGRADMGAYEFGLGDYDCDRAVSLSDFAWWASCATGPAAPGAAVTQDACAAFDSNRDGDVDLADFQSWP